MPTKSNKTVAKSGFSAKPQPQPEAETVAPVEADQSQATTIADLQSKLAAATSQGAELQQTIAALETKLTAQAKTVETLQTEAKAFGTLKTTLEKAEAAARQLAALNNTLLAENSALKEAATAALVPEPPQSTALAAPQRSLNNLVHPVFPNGPLPSGIGDQEIGWFD